MTDTTETPPIRAPRSVKAATELLERFAELDGKIAGIEAERNARIVAINADADDRALGLIRDRDAIFAKLAAWWPGASAELTEGKRKSIELGGCMIGGRQGKDTLAIDGDEKTIVTQLKKHRWARPLLKVRTSLDKVAILKSVDGLHGETLRSLGLSRKPGAETVFVERTEQGGTLGTSK